MTTTVLNTKIGEVENKIPNVSGLLKKKPKKTIDYDAKISEIEGKYFTTANYELYTRCKDKTKIISQQIFFMS